MKRKRTLLKSAAYLMRCLVCKITFKTLASVRLTKQLLLNVFSFIIKVKNHMLFLRHISFQMKQAKFKDDLQVHNL